MVKILALDLGDTTGWASFRDGELRSGILDLKIRLEEHPGARWRRARDAFRELVRGHDLVAWELIISGGFGQGAFAKSTLYGLEVQVVEISHELGVEPLTVAPMTLKKFAAGTGKATKADMRAAGRVRWPGVTFATHDEIDARWISAWALEHCGHLPASVLK